METTRKILSACVGLLLAIALFLGITSFAVTSYLGSSENIKQTLNDSGIYDSLVNNITSAIKKEAQQEQGQPSNKKQDLPLDNPKVQAAINKAFPPSFWQNSAEQIIDGAYAWLDGSTTIIKNDYWNSRRNIKPIELYNALAEVTKLTIITATEDKVLTNTDFSGLSDKITLIKLKANHNFTEDRNELMQTINKVLGKNE